MSKPKLEDRYDFSLAKIILLFLLQLSTSALLTLKGDEWKEIVKNNKIISHLLILAIVGASIIIVIEEGKFNLLRYISFTVFMYIVVLLALKVSLLWILPFMLAIIIYVQYNVATYEYGTEKIVG